jgi:methyltransferase (TIGR00027 family)
MIAGRASQTAVMVCMARAVAHGTSLDDPTALPLLPDDARARVEQFRAGDKPRGFRARMAYGALAGRAHMMTARTIAIDEAIRHAAAPQLVILGAGLDGRAWRMRELHDTVVFEVDHPDSQRAKRDRAAALAAPRARDVRFTAVDFTRDSLADALAAAGHDAALPTTWVWEGVVMYLQRAEIEASLAALAGRSAPGSRLVIAYLQPSPVIWIIRPLVRRIGEPIQTVLTATAMQELLARHGFVVVRDETIATIGARLAPAIAKATRVLTHMRIVTADRR